MDNSLASFLLALALIILIIVVAAVILIWLLVRRLQRFTSPNVQVLQQQLTRRQAAQPALPLEAQLNAIIRQQSFRSGIVGALAGLGGFVTLPIALPIDLLLSIQIQTTLVQFIATSYGQAPTNNTAQRIQTALITTGSTQVTERTLGLVTRIAVRFLGESLSLLVPILSVATGFVVNYTIARAAGEGALRWYAHAARSVITPPRQH